MLKIVRPVSFVLLSAAFCSGGVVHASDRAAITPRVGISQQEGSLKGTVSAVSYTHLTLPTIA